MSNGQSYTYTIAPFPQISSGPMLNDWRSKLQIRLLHQTHEEIELEEKNISCLYIVRKRHIPDQSYTYIHVRTINQKALKSQKELHFTTGS